MKTILPKLLAIPYHYFLLKSLLTTSLAVLLQFLFQNYLSILISPSKCLRNVHLPCKCIVMSSLNINFRVDSGIIKQCTHPHPPKIFTHSPPTTQNNIRPTQNNAPLTPTHPYLTKIMVLTPPTHPK